MKKRNSRGRTPDGKPNPVDVHVGNRIKLRRQLLGLSQEKLSAMLGLTFQQIQKYERGTNRVGASRLWDIARVLNTTILFFYEDMPEEIINQSPMMLSISKKISILDIEPTDPMNTDEAVELVKNFYKIKNRRLADNLFESIKEAARSSN